MRQAGTGTGQMYFSLMWLTMFLLILAFSFTVDSAHVAYKALSSVAQESAWSGQAQIIRTGSDGSGDGYFASTVTADSSKVQQAVQMAWQANINGMQLQNSFSNLTINSSITGSVVSVTVKGTYTPPWLKQAFAAVFGGTYKVSFQIPMSATASGNI